MKQIIITAQQQKREFRIFLYCFVVAFLLNVLGIALYKTPWHEVFTQLGYVIIIASALYFLTVFVRLIFYLIFVAIKKKR